MSADAEAHAFAENLLEQLAKARGALRAVLLFHRGGPWGREEQAQWAVLTGRTDATTKALCDTVRAALGEP